MRKKILDTIRKLRSMEARRARLIEALTGAIDEPLLAGSLSLVNRTCGNPTCHCARTPAHPAWVLATTRDSRRRCQVVRQADVERIRGTVGAYKAFKQSLRDLEAIHRDEIVLLRVLLETRNMLYE